MTDNLIKLIAMAKTGYSHLLIQSVSNFLPRMTEEERACWVKALTHAAVDFDQSLRQLANAIEDEDGKRDR